MLRSVYVSLRCTDPEIQIGTQPLRNKKDYHLFSTRLFIFAKGAIINIIYCTY